MAYIGTSPQNGVRNRFVYAATQGQTAFTGADADSKTLVVSDQLYTDVYQNGVKLKLTTDWTATATTVTLVNAASVDDVIEILSFDVFSVSDTVPASTGGTFNGAISATSYGAVSGTTGTFSGALTVGTNTSGIVNLKGGSSTSPQMRFFDGGTGKARIGVPTGQTYLSLSGADTLTADVSILADGNVGIGTTSPSGKLTIEGTQNSLDSQLKVTASGQVSQYMGGSSTVGLALGHDHASLPIVFKTGVNSGTGVTGSGTERVRILGTGGLTFNGDTAAANALDDYEEGTWTAAFTSASGSITINASSGVYTKIGRQVTVSGAFSVGSVSSPSGDMGMTGLPFASASGAGFSTAATIWLNTINSQASKTIQARMDGNNSQFFIFDLADGNASGASAYFKANSVINVSLTYFTA